MIKYLKKIAGKLRIMPYEIPIKLGIKPIKYWIDDNCREKIKPIEGSVLYSDLVFGAEHSGIYIGNSEISNIYVEKFVEAVVKKSSPYKFTEKSLLHKKIYVSCDKDGAVGDISISDGAKSRIGERGFYGLVFSNCHSFSSECLEYSDQSHGGFNIKNLFDFLEIDETWESTIKDLKKKAKKKINARKWRLWDWQNDKDDKDEKVEKPKINEINSFFQNFPLNSENIKYIQNELLEGLRYKEEISDEKLDQDSVKTLSIFIENLEKVDKKYKEVKDFIKLSGHDYSYNQLKELNEDFISLAEELEKNSKVKEICRKLGKNYILEKKKKSKKIKIRAKNEVFGIHKSNDLVRLMPSELVNFDTEETEYLFYTKYLESSLLTYEVGGEESRRKDEEEKAKSKGPVIACIDTSGSMNGSPLLKAKALLLAISNILERENRSLYIILFGSKGELMELNIDKKDQGLEILPFMKKAFNGGTDFETPLRRAIDIINRKKVYNKSDILMVTDGLCSLSEEFLEEFERNRNRLDISVYTVLCAGAVEKDIWSDETINI